LEKEKGERAARELEIKQRLEKDLEIKTREIEKQQEENRLKAEQEIEVKRNEDIEVERLKQQHLEEEKKIFIEKIRLVEVERLRQRDEEEQRREKEREAKKEQEERAEMALMESLAVKAWDYETSQKIKTAEQMIPEVITNSNRVQKDETNKVLERHWNDLANTAIHNSCNKDFLYCVDITQPEKMMEVFDQELRGALSLTNDDGVEEKTNTNLDCVQSAIDDDDLYSIQQEEGSLVQALNCWQQWMSNNSIDINTGSDHNTNMDINKTNVNKNVNTDRNLNRVSEISKRDSSVILTKVYIYIYINICIYIFIYICIYIYVYKYTYILNIYIYIFIYICIRRSWINCCPSASEHQKLTNRILVIYAYMCIFI
jgi:hypothetical protein